MMTPARGMAVATAAMVVVVVASNILVHFPINEWLTWGAFTFPFAFLVTDLSNRAYGPMKAVRVVTVGFVVGILMSAVFSDWPEPFGGWPVICSEVAVLTAVASGSAFLSGQLLDIAIFQRLRHGHWWKAPLVSSAVASGIDTLIFFYLLFGLFYPEWGLDWFKLGIGDYAIKGFMALTLLAPYRVLMGVFAPHLFAPRRG
jgi:queuosine precursor transporter